MKELSDFDFGSVPSLNKAKVIELAKCGYITSKTNVVLMGPPGVGKTHLAISLTLNACRQGYNARFFTAAEIVNTYREARESKTIMRLEASLCRMHLSVIVTTNLPFAQWPSTFAGEERMTGALLDRLTHRLEALSINDKEETFSGQTKPQEQRQKELRHSGLAIKTSGLKWPFFRLPKLIFGCQTGLFFDCHFQTKVGGPSDETD